MNTPEPPLSGRSQEDASKHAYSAPGNPGAPLAPDSATSSARSGAGTAANGANKQVSMPNMPAHEAQATPYGAPARMSGMAITSLVLSIIGIVGSWMPILNNVAFILAVLGFIFAIVALIAMRKKNLGGKGLAIAGLVLSILGIIIVLYTQNMYANAWNKAFNDVSNASPQAQQNPTSGSSSKTSGSSATSSNRKDAQSAAKALAAAAAVSKAQKEAASKAKYSVSVDSMKKTQTYDHKPAIAVTYTWKNVGTSTSSFSTTFSARAYQNGVELHHSYKTGVTNNEHTQLKPDATLQVVEMYELNDNSEVTVEVTPWINFNGDKGVITSKKFPVA